MMRRSRVGAIPCGCPFAGCGKADVLASKFCGGLPISDTLPNRGVSPAIFVVNCNETKQRGVSPDLKNGHDAFRCQG